MPPTSRIDLPQGTLDLLILRAISLEPLHGWAISQRIQQLSNEVLQVPQGSLYPALHRLERRGLVKSSWDVTDNNRRARYYHLTPLGRRQLEKETADWRKLVGAVTQLLETS
jgi:PadR family transcriptional regulator, regulatory protein PadR